MNAIMGLMGMDEAQIATNLELRYANLDDWSSDLPLKEFDETGLCFIGVSEGKRANGTDGTKA